MGISGPGKSLGEAEGRIGSGRCTNSKEDALEWHGQGGQGGETRQQAVVLLSIGRPF